MKSFFGPKPPVKKKKKWKGPSQTSVLTDQVIKYIKSKGGAARRVNTQGQWDEENQRWRTSGMKRGFEDVSAIFPIVNAKGVKVGGQYFAIEIKVGRDTQSDKQEEREREVVESGGIYWVVTNFERFKIAFDKTTDQLTRITDSSDVNEIHYQVWEF